MLTHKSTANRWIGLEVLLSLVRKVGIGLGLLLATALVRTYRNPGEILTWQHCHFEYNIFSCLTHRPRLSFSITEKGASEMFVVHVHVHVKPESIEAFKEASTENARHSVQEPGIARFDVIQQRDDPSRFVLVEVYRTPDDPARHKETAHYQAWRDAVADMMAEPRSSVKYTNVFPDEAGWG